MLSALKAGTEMVDFNLVPRGDRSCHAMLSQHALLAHNPWAWWLGLGCVLAVVTNNCFGHWPVVNQWPIQPQQSLVRTVKLHSWNWFIKMR